MSHGKAFVIMCFLKNSSVIKEGPNAAHIMGTSYLFGEESKGGRGCYFRVFLSSVCTMAVHPCCLCYILCAVRCFKQELKRNP